MDIVAELMNHFRNQRENPAMPHRAIVFWYDTNSDDRDLAEIEEVLATENIKFWELAENNTFQTKITLEMEDTESSYLIYAPFLKPIDEENYLLDILLYAGEYGEFQADEIAITMKELHMDHLAIRPFIQKYWTFFNDKKRKAKFKKLLPTEVTEEQVKRAMLAVLTGSSTIQTTDIVRTVLKQGIDQDKNDAISKVDKLLDRTLFLELAEDYFGIEHDGNDRLEKLFYTIVYNHFVSDIDFALPPSFQYHYPSMLPNTCRVFLEDWFRMDGNKELDQQLRSVEKEWNISELLLEKPYTMFHRCDTFPVVDQLLIDSLLQQLLNETVDVSEWKGILTQRKNHYWYKDESFYPRYQLLESALDVYEFKGKLRLMQEPKDEKEWIQSYTNSYFQIDQTYRKFMFRFQKSSDVDMFDSLVERITNWYENDYLMTIASTNDFLMDKRMADKWPIFEALKQRSFYSTLIKPLIEGTKERVFVIISDALRYEAGEELKRDLQMNLNSDVALTPMQTTLPSYTQLGMASLLPGKITGLKDDGTVEVNGVSSRGLANREKILQLAEVDSKALHLTNFLSLKVEEGTKLIKGQRVVYLYHDRIDATGDSGKSEFYSFEAVEQAINDLKQAVKKLVGTYGAPRIFITSDHGFLYQASSIESHQKSLAVKGDILDHNRRFVIGRNLEIPEGARRISLDYLGLDLEAAVAKGLNRFKGSGGLRFVHGGSLPQEAIVPVIEYRSIRGKSKMKQEERVDVQIALRNKTITNYRFKVPFFQEEKASQKRYSRDLRVAFYRGNERISNEISITFDSTKEAVERQQEVTFSLLESNYKTGDRCVLRMEDVSTAKTELYHEEEFELRLYHIK